MPGNSYDGHTLDEALEQTEILFEVKPEQALEGACLLCREGRWPKYVSLRANPSSAEESHGFARPIAKKFMKRKSRKLRLCGRSMPSS
jgi:hypothetical protein